MKRKIDFTRCRLLRAKSHSIQSIKKFLINKTDAQQRKANRLKACLKTKGSCQRMINHSVSRSQRKYTSEVNMEPRSIVNVRGGQQLILQSYRIRHESSISRHKKLVYDSTLCINKILSDLADNWHREFFSISTGAR